MSVRVDEVGVEVLHLERGRSGVGGRGIQLGNWVVGVCSTEAHKEGSLL